MAGKIGDELDPAELDILCQERKIKRQEKTRDDINSQLEAMAESWIPHSEAVAETRPYGVEHEGQAYDVWYLILGNFTDPREIKNLWKVSGMFRAILRSKYIETMLPEVVKLVLSKHPNFILPANNNNEEGNAETSAFLNTRLISKQCRKSVEDIYGIPVRLELYAVGKVETVNEKIQESPSIAMSSFLTFDVLVQGEDIEGEGRDIQEFTQGITDLLGKIGHRVRCFNFYSVLLRNFAEESNCLREWASLMPNLERLSFSLKHVADNQDNPPPLEEIEPFPELPRVQSIEEWSYFCVISHPFVRRILEACPRMQDLQFYDFHWVREHPVQALRALTNLTSLQIGAYPALLQHRNLPWKLNKLIIDGKEAPFHGIGKTKTEVSSCTLFPFLKQFEETLEHLELRRINVISGGDYLTLGKLKTLKMELHKSLDSLNFLLYMEKLETLVVTMGDDCMDSLSATERLSRVWKMGHSGWNLSAHEKFRRIVSGSFSGRRVWEVFPNLETFQMCTEDYWEYMGNVRGTKLEELRRDL